MATSGDKLKVKEMLRRSIDFVFGFKNRKGEVLDYWIYPADALGFSSADFYAAVEQQMAARKIPGMEIVRQEFAEGGLLSDRRAYLRLMRERFAITTCAAPMGNFFFFSCRCIYVPALVRLWHILAAIVFFFLAFRMLIIPLGITFASMALVALIFAIAGVLRNATAAGFSDLDAFLLKMPVIATIYENWFREETYYREDTRNLYLKLLPKLILELAEGECAAKGVKLQWQLRPIPEMQDLNKSGASDKKPAAA
ncbi:MAG TPA: hypothetical protein VH413_11570 [Verrucomicrobiae bacterium]|jgi:hypothetical protein|nr:hypothetical protein [Verrucomicrobiae bacterium]